LSLSAFMGNQQTTSSIRMLHREMRGNLQLYYIPMEEHSWPRQNPRR
jgi:hypothetical protein